MNKQVVKNVSLAGFLITFIAAILFSTKAIIVKKAFANTDVDALTLLTLRMTFSLPFYLAIAIFTSSKKDNVAMSRRQWLYVIALGVIGYYLSSYFDFVGLQYISAGLERLILFLFPTFVVLINAWVFKEKMSGIQKLALMLTYAGIAIAYFGELQLEMSENFLFGSFMIFACAITYSFYVVGSGRFIPFIGAAKFTAYAMLASTTGVFIHFLFAGNYKTLNTGSNLWWYGILLAVVATVIPSFMISNGMKKIGSNNVAIVSSIGPVSTILQAHFILGEEIFAAQIAGTLFVIVGVLLIGWHSRQAKE
jgi:drug/metabolite transporter (DMT)-like permease